MRVACPICGVSFSRFKSDHLYCGKICRNEAYRRRYVKSKGEKQKRTPRPGIDGEVPIAIVAHPNRQPWAEELAEKVRAEVIMVDDRGLGCERNHLRALRWLADGAASWSVVMEDDALPVRGFSSQLKQVLHAAPTPIVSLYLGRGRPPHWQSSIALSVTTPACFFRGPALLHGVCYAIRTGLIPGCLEKIEYLVTRKDDPMPIDEAISEWARVSRYRVCHTWPSLVDHRDTGTLNDHADGQPRTELRRAWCVDVRSSWTPSVVDMPIPPELGGEKFPKLAIV